LEEFHPQVHYFLEKAYLIINRMDIQLESQYGFITAYERKLKPSKFCQLRYEGESSTELSWMNKHVEKVEPTGNHSIQQACRQQKHEEEGESR